MYEMYIPRKGLQPKSSPSSIAQYKTKQGWNVTTLYIATDLINKLIGPGKYIELRVDRANNKIAIMKSNTNAPNAMKIARFPKRCMLQVGKLDEVIRTCDITECRAEFQKGIIDGQDAIIMSIPKEIAKTSQSKKEVKLLPKPVNGAKVAEARVH